MHAQDALVVYGELLVGASACGMHVQKACVHGAGCPRCVRCVTTMFPQFFAPDPHRDVLLPVLTFAVMGGKMAQPGSSYSSSSRRLCEHACRPILAQGVSGTGRMLRLAFQEGVWYYRYLGGTLPSAWE